METIDLHRHGILEASAGTGKTYSIERLVLRILKEEQVPLEEILIVTFTEKATGELKGRLRSAVDKELKEFPQYRDILQKASDHFDQAAIFTLHGFCQRILQEYPIEQGQEVRCGLVNDKDLVESALREVQRRNWRQDFGELLHEVLELAGYNRQEANTWERTVKDLVIRWRPECGERLLPPLVSDWPTLLVSLTNKLQAALPRLRELLANPSLRENGHLRGSWVAKLKQWANNPDTTERFLITFCKFIDHKDIREAGARGFLNLIPAKQAGKDNPVTEPILRLLEDIRQAADWTRFDQQLMVRTVYQVQEYMDDFKRQHGLQSFQDMISRLAEGLEPEKNPLADELAAILRQRFRYAIVDEFQDTDPLQWRILRRIFLPEVAEKQKAISNKLKKTKSQKPKTTNHLFVVGDPKQAIFGFRGCDLPTYLQARQEMLTQHQAQERPLLINWRSDPKLIEGLNHLFMEGQWFPSEHGIPYQPVQAPPADQARVRIDKDQTGRPALNLIDWQVDEKLALLRRRHARFIVEEIQRLLAPASSLEFTCNRETRALRYDDICVLVFKRNEAKPLLTALAEAGIPYSFYKQTGLWQSEEAIYLRLVLEALAQPEHRPAFRKALLTPFFRISPQELAGAEDLPDYHPARVLFNQWFDLIADRKWAGLFQSLLEDSGLLLQEGAPGENDRRRANFKHLACSLAQEAYRQNLDLLGLVDLCRQNQQVPAEDDDYQPKETENPRVKIMTIHASKGLEFPIVFLAGGWTKSNKSELVKFRENDRLVYDLTGEAKEKSRAEQEQEQRRLLYVALTRAMFKLYLPHVLEDAKKFGHSAGPLVKILAPALNKAGFRSQEPGARNQEAGARRQEPGSSNLKQQGQGIPPPPDSCILAPGSLPLSASWQIPGPLFPVLDADIFRRGIVVRSFTSLHRAGALHALEGSSFTEQPPRVQDEDTGEQNQEEPLRGPVFGDIVHGVLENIDFVAVGQAATPDLLLTAGSTTEAVLARQVDRSLAQLPARLPPDKLRDLCRTQVASLVWRALQTPLEELGGPLWQIPPQDRLHELEFQFPEEFNRPPGEETEKEERSRSPSAEEGFLTGFMDLVVRKNGRFFLFDWKTNVLAGYSPEEVTRSMEECDYLRQYRLYLHALDRWLQRTLGPTYERSRQLGGVYYLYVRGLNGHDETSGVYFHPPTPQDLHLDVVLETNRH